MPDKTFSSAQSRLSLNASVGKYRSMSSCFGSLGLVSGSPVPDSVARFAEVGPVCGGAGGSCSLRRVS
jgi:hypothetical protein